MWWNKKEREYPNQKEICDRGLKFAIEILESHRDRVDRGTEIISKEFLAGGVRQGSLTPKLFDSFKVTSEYMEPIISCDKCKHLIYKKDAVLLEGIFTCPNCCENKNWTAVYCNITGCNEPKKPKSKPKKGKK